MAGEGAAEQARLAAERVAKLRQKLEEAERVERAWAKGAAGEALVGQVLDELVSKGWFALHDVHWPGRSRANLDHILIGPGGVLVIDAKSWSGDVKVQNGALRQNGYSRDRAVSGALDQCAAVSALLEPQHRRLVQAWVCLVDQPEVASVTSSGVRVQGLATLGAALDVLPAVLDPATVQVIHGYLSGMLSGETSPPLLTIGDYDDRPADLGLAPGPTFAAETRRSRRHTVASRSSRPGSRRTPAKTAGCFRALIYFAVAIFILGFVLNALPHAQRQSPAVPRPTPSQVQSFPSS